MIFHEKYGFVQVGTQTTENEKKEVSLMEYKIPSI
jgi:predicted GNAT superfamily acetyltransferase